MKVFGVFFSHVSNSLTTNLITVALSLSHIGCLFGSMKRFAFKIHTCQALIIKGNVSSNTIFSYIHILPLLFLCVFLASLCSHDFIGEFSTSYRELSRGQSQFNVYEVSLCVSSRVLYMCVTVFKSTMTFLSGLVYRAAGDSHTQ